MIPTEKRYNSWIICPKPNPHAFMRLFCLPYAGGSSVIFRLWPDSLPTNVEVCCIELPGRGNQIKSAPFTSLEPLVNAIAAAVVPHLDKPFAFFGHSMGGLLSFEVIRLLRKNYGLSPVYLFISASRAPQIPDPDPPIHALPEAEFIEELRRLNGTPAAVLENAELMQLLIPTLRADFAVLETYVYTPGTILDCAIATFGGLQDQEVSRDDLQAWGELTTATFSLQMFPGNHFFLNSMRSQLLESISQKLQTC